MSATDYVARVREAVERAIRLSDYPSPFVRGDNKPMIEVASHDHPLIADTVIISRGSGESCLVEWSMNAARISFKFKTSDSLDGHILESYMKFFMQR